MTVMKKTKYHILTILLLIGISCEQVPIELTPPEEVVPLPDCPAGASAGQASFTKFVAIGNSFVAGVQGGALFTEGQNNSLAAILHKQFMCVGAPATFNQPTINASLGWNLFVTQPFLTDNTKPILGRMLLQGNPPRPTPQPYAVGNLEALPNPTANPGFIYTGGKATLNNFAVPAIFLGQSLIPQTGAWAGAGTDPRFSPFYGRMQAPPGGTTTIIGDAIASGSSFFLLWLGLDDFFLHAAFGADATRAPLTVANGGAPSNFDFQYTAAITALLNSNANLKGVVGNFPDVFKMPHFTAVPFNPVPMTTDQATAATTGFAGYNGAMTGLSNALAANPGLFGLTAGQAAPIIAQLATRLASFAAGANKVLLIDESLINLGPFFDGMLGAGAITAAQRAALTPFQQVRQSTSADVIPLGAGAVIGTPGTFGVLGVSEPLADRYVITATEKTQIMDARAAYNTIVQAVVNNNSTKLALADVSAAMDAFVTSGVLFGPDWNNVTMTPNINPPTGIYSEDGAHFNSRGYAFISRTFISAINTKFAATIPLTNVGKYKATGLPIP
jgi:hypothetical protein